MDHPTGTDGPTPAAADDPDADRAATDATRTCLRHLLATIAYRGGKTLRDAPDGFAAFSAGDESRTAVQILSHLGDLFDWGLALTDGKHRWHDTRSDDWNGQVDRFFAGLAAVDARLSAPAPVARNALRLIQGPFADALTHVGQIALLRRLAGSPVKGENYFKASIEVGRVGIEQAPPVFEFD